MTPPTDPKLVADDLASRLESLRALFIELLPASLRRLGQTPGARWPIPPSEPETTDLERVAAMLGPRQGRRLLAARDRLAASHRRAWKYLEAQRRKEETRRRYAQKLADGASRRNGSGAGW